MAFISFRAAIGAIVFAVLFPSHSLRGQSCDLLVAALAAVNADSSNTVVVDHTVIGVPQFALHAYSGIQRGDTVFVAVASGDLNARGVLLQFVRDADRHWIKRAEAQLWVA